MGQRFGGAAALVRKSALEWGRSQIGSENYNYRAALGKWKNPSWKCNAFVIRAFNHNVIPETIGEKANPETWGLTSRAYLEVISKLLKIVKAPSLRSAKGSVFGCYLTGSNLKLPFTALCEWHLCHFLNDF